MVYNKMKDGRYNPKLNVLFLSTKGFHIDFMHVGMQQKMNRGLLSCKVVTPAGHFS